MSFENISATSRILMADDDTLIRTMLSKALMQEGYQVISFTNGHDLLTEYEANGSNVVLLDGQMPIMDGFTCCHYITQQSRSRYTPVLMITGLDDARAVDQAFNVGATDYITKPVHWPILRQRVRMAVERSQMLQLLDSLDAQAASRIALLI